MNKEDMTESILNNEKLIFMEFIGKKQDKEFTVDIYYGRDNRAKAIIPRERIEIRSGEINKGLTHKNYIIKYLKERMEYLPCVIGCICIQLFYRESDNDVVAIEINPRYGGGYPLSYYAGAKFPQYMIEEYMKGKTIDYIENWKNHTLMLRYDADVIVYEE